MGFVLGAKTAPRSDQKRVIEETGDEEEISERKVGKKERKRAYKRIEKCINLRLGEKLDFDDPLNEFAWFFVPEASEIELKNVYFQRRRS